MRKTVLAISAAAALACASVPASAQNMWGPTGYSAPVVTGVVVGTVVGVGLYNNWFGSGRFVSSLPGSTWAGAATAGFVAGVGTVAIIHAFTTPCTGFQALLAAPGCGQPVQRVAMRRR